MAYATFVTSHTLVISKDTKPTRSPTQFSRMQPKWSRTQALSLAGRKRTEESDTNAVEKKGVESNQRFILTYHADFFFLFKMHRYRVCGEGTHTLASTHMNALPLHSDRNRHNETSVLLHQGRTLEWLSDKSSWLVLK